VVVSRGAGAFGPRLVPVSPTPRRLERERVRSVLRERGPAECDHKATVDKHALQLSGVSSCVACACNVGQNCKGVIADPRNLVARE